MNTPNPLCILVDQDGVLAKYNEHLLAIWKQEHPDKIYLPPQMIVNHETEKNFPTEYEKFFEEIVLRKGFYRSLPLMEGAREALEELLALGHNVRICTAPKREYQNCTLEKMEWIDEHLGRTWTDRTIITRDKTLVHGDFLIDDKPNITGTRKPSWEHILYDQPYNNQFLQRRLTWANYKEILRL